LEAVGTFRVSGGQAEQQGAEKQASVFHTMTIQHLQIRNTQIL
jgi:hypothetical protein